MFLQLLNDYRHFAVKSIPFRIFQIPASTVYAFLQCNADFKEEKVHNRDNKWKQDYG